jgi:hypothetical protein
MLKTALFFVLVTVFAVSSNAQVPSNVEKAQRNRIDKDKITVEKNYIQASEQSTWNMLALENRSSSQLQELGARYGFLRSNSQLEELGARYGFLRSNSQLEELGARYGFLRSNSQLEELGARYGFLR